MDFTFLTEEQIFGFNSLEIFRRYGRSCSVTDFTILLGAATFGVYSWWTKTPDQGDVLCVNDLSDFSPKNINYRTAGARPAIPYSSISYLAQNKRIEEHGALEVEYGEYPQTVVSKENSETLESAFQKGLLKPTGKTYTTDSVLYNEITTPINPKKHIEYEYNGEKYIRVVGNSICSGNLLSDYREIQTGSSYWVKVEPIKWLVDEKKDIAVSKYILFTGVQFDRNLKFGYRGDFDKTNIKQFMDKYFAKEIEPSITKEILLKEFLENNKKPKRSNPYGFNFGQVSEEDIIRGSIESGLSVFLHGRSSEGKSARVKQIDPDCTIIYLRTATPESLNGKSVYDSTTGQMVDVKPTWLTKLEEKCASEPDKIHILFFDEITNALPSIQGMAFNIVLDKEVNGKWKLPENARIVAAGNDMKDSLAANQLAEPLFNRFVHVYIETTVETWLRWASENNIHPAIYAYIAYKRDEVLRSNYNGETPNADPRKWEMASKMLYTTKNPEMLRGLLGEDITRDFVEFCRQRVITLEEVIKGTYNTRDIENLNTAERYATVMGLSQVDEENLEVIRDFVNNLGSEFCAIFDTLWINGDETRLETIAELKLKDKKI